MKWAAELSHVDFSTVYATVALSDPQIERDKADVGIE